MVTSIKDQTKEVNTAIDSITIEATDNSGQAVTNKVSGLPEGVSFDSETNTISGTPTKVGNYPITVTTTDASGNKTETKFTIKVERLPQRLKLSQTKQKRLIHQLTQSRSKHRITVANL